MDEFAKLEITGAKELRKIIKNANDNDLKKSLKEANKAGSEVVAEKARFLVPVKSGRLKASVRAGATQSNGWVAVGKKAVPYAAPIHFGWFKRHIKPQPFLYEAADARIGAVLAAYEDAINEVISKIGDT